MTSNNVFQQFAAWVSDAAVKSGLTLEQPVIELPRDPSHGDWTTSSALALAKQAGKPPRAIAEQMMAHIQQQPDVAEVSVAGPGFINVRMAPQFWLKQINIILQAGTSYGDSTLGGGEPVNVEYVSANPTGPMHTGHARNVCLGEALASLLQKAGWKVTREFYLNDAGNQVDVLANSTYLRYREALGEDIGEIPAGLYPGDYLKEVAQALVARDGDKWLKVAESEWMPAIMAFAIDSLMAEIKQDLHDIGVTMDVYTSEKKLRESGAVEKALQTLTEKGLIYRGVLEPPKGKVLDDWEPVEQTLFRATQFGDDVDRVVVKADGGLTYFAVDIAYHMDKLQRTGKRLITVVGSDHGGWVKRIKAAVAALSDNQAEMSIKMYALVNTFENGEPVRMSKRAGTFITLRDILARVGKDVMRFAMLARRPEEVIDFDFVKVVEQSRDNPVFYVQYAHARCYSVFRQAGEQGVMPKDFAAANLSRLQDEAELELIRKLCEWPRLIDQAATAQEPHRIAYFLYDLATVFHSLWHKGNDNATLRFIQKDDAEVTAARLAMVKAVATVIASGLNVLGVTPVEEMH